MKKYIILIFIIISASANAQSVKKPYKSLEKYDYAKAKEGFQKILAENKESVSGNFGLALVLADEKSPYFDIIDAWEYIELVQGKESNLSQDEMEIMAEYFLNTEVRKTSRPVKKKIEIAIEAIESRLIKYIREENDLDACYEVLERYPDFRHFDNVVHIRNQFEFRKYEKQNTFAGYNEFIVKFPEAAQVDKAKRYRDKMAFEEIKAQNTVEAFNRYIDGYPGSRYVQQAAKLRNAAAFKQAKSIHTLEIYEKFIEMYPDALEIPEARKFQHELMYEKAKRIKNLEAYNEFIRMYPNGGYYIDVFNLKSGDLGMQAFKEINFDSPDIIWSKALDNNEGLEQAKAIVATSDNGFVVAGLTRKTDTSFADAWIVKLDSTGQMLWNKQVGQPYEDEILEVMETSAGEIVVVGYTKISPDSSAKNMGWMFKLSSNGSRVWNKNLGEMNISAVAMGNDDRVYLSTYTCDTVADNYFLQSFNLDGNKVSERDFVRKGRFNDVLFPEGESAFLLGSEWFALIDKKFYLKWEDTLCFTSELHFADIAKSKIVMYASDTLTNYLLGYNLTLGNKLWDVAFPKRDSADVVKQLIVDKNENIALIGNDTNGNYAIKYNATGQKVSEKLMPANYVIIRAIKKTAGEIVYLIENGKDIIVLNFNSLGY